MSKNYQSIREDLDALIEKESSPPSTPLTEEPQKKQAVLLGLLFCILFLAFNATQNLQSTVNKKLGFWSLAILYIVFATSNFFAPAVVMKIGEK